jgi:hypothetical protein
VDELRQQEPRRQPDGRRLSARPFEVGLAQSNGGQTTGEIGGSVFSHAPAPSTRRNDRSTPSHRSARPPRVTRGRLAQWGVEANERLTGSTALILLILLAVEGVTVLRVQSLLTVHVFIGMLLVPPILVKMSSTTWRFARYYLGSPEYRHKGPPPVALRVLGPFVIVVTVVLFASGILLLLEPGAWHDRLLQLHKVSFIMWFVFMTVHVLGHMKDVARVSTKDWARRTRGMVGGSGSRQFLITLSLIIGVVLGLLTIPHVGSWLQSVRH